MLAFHFTDMFTAHKCAKDLVVAGAKPTLTHLMQPRSMYGGHAAAAAALQAYYVGGPTGEGATAAATC